MASRRGQMIDGVLLLDKPVGLSSNHALQRAKRTIDARKAGHTGTLDPFATGVLVCCFGRATKISAVMLEADKVYEATIKFGVETDSGDLTGNIVATANDELVAAVTEHLFVASLAKFRGEIQQIPPMISALKKDGKPLYKYAREGIEIERPARNVNIHALDLLSFDNSSAKIRVHCSKGTYIRTLAQDIGRELGCLGHLSDLRRTAVGPFEISKSTTLEQLQEHTDPKQLLIPLADLPPEVCPANFLNREIL